MKIFFRADGNKNIGWGHVMRSISIAAAYAGQGNECIFVCADNSMNDVITGYGFRMINLNSDYTQMNDELHGFLELINSEKPELIFFDSYYVNSEYLTAIKEKCKTVYIDDLFSFPYPVDCILNYNIYADKQRYLNLYGDKKLPELFLNISYAPLRKEFRGIHREFSKDVKNIFISCGGSDEYGLVLKIIKKLIEDNEFTNKCIFHFILGSYEPDREEVINLAGQYKWLVVHEKVNNIADIMKICDIAISAAGSTLYELCACRVPTVTYVLADNQLNGANAFQEKKLMIYAGDIRENNYSIQEIIEKLKILYHDNKLRKELFDRMSKLVDGYGANKIEKMINGK